MEHSTSSETSNTLVTIQDVTKTYDSKNGSVTALKNINLTIYREEFVSLIGPSGCGKSTLLRLLAGLDQKYEGKIIWTHQPEPGKDIGFVFQDSALLPWRTVEGNVALGIETQKNPRVDPGRIEYLLELVGLQDFRKAYPAQLSGGMKQRVSIVRALAYDPQILLMDEPFGALDAITRDKLHENLLEIWEETRKTIVIVTHAVDEATYLSDRVAVMSARPGQLQSLHTVPMDRPREATVRDTKEFLSFSGMLRKELI